MLIQPPCITSTSDSNTSAPSSPMTTSTEDMETIAIKSSALTAGEPGHCGLQLHLLQTEAANLMNTLQELRKEESVPMMAGVINSLEERLQEVQHRISKASELWDIFSKLPDEFSKFYENELMYAENFIFKIINSDFSYKEFFINIEQTNIKLHFNYDTIENTLTCSVKLSGAVQKKIAVWKTIAIFLHKENAIKNLTLGALWQWQISDKDEFSQSFELIKILIHLISPQSGAFSSRTVSEQSHAIKLCRQILKKDYGCSTSILMASAGLRNMDQDVCRQALKIFEILFRKELHYQTASINARLLVESENDDHLDTGLQLYTMLVNWGFAKADALKAISKGLKDEDSACYNSACRLLIALMNQEKGFDLANETVIDGFRNPHPFNQVSLLQVFHHLNKNHKATEECTRTVRDAEDLLIPEAKELALALFMEKQL